MVNATNGNAIVILTNAVVQPGQLSYDLMQSLDQK